MCIVSFLTEFDRALIPMHKFDRASIPGNLNALIRLGINANGFPPQN